MGKKAKSSRKGKKAWRANISMEEVDDYFEKSTKDALSGGSLTELPSESLFYLDKSRDLSVKRKIEKHREKVLRCDSLLQRNSFVEAVPSSTKRKSQKKRKEVQKAKDVVQNGPMGDGVSDSGMVDMWDNRGEHNNETKKMAKPSIIPAVEVEPPGCSFNPAFESHQDSLALAVADEMQKIYRNELGPKPVPLTVPGEVIDEEDIYFLEADNSDDDDDPNVKNLHENGDSELEKRSFTTKRVTQVELNRRARRKEQLRSEAEAKKTEGLSKEIDCIPDIIQEIAKEDEEKHRRRLRRIVAKQERLKSCPPRLGKHKFEPAPVQVLLSEEITGSLRKLKGCCTLARDRYKSLEKRGLIVPTVKTSRK
ncbi:ribosome biogenesis protein NOP53-like [Cornus florida]|uniref:ribosome biogenesis protein NOP53-like n=1 Tax=Cornus florida TaxID=4283 RepID=UPI0028986B99|nr:ribosome biogenesis protein NOP53-like [Cornus florida]